MMSSEASKYSVESWPVTSIEEKEKEKRLGSRRGGRGRDAVACEMHRAVNAPASHGPPVQHSVRAVHL